MIDSLPVGWWRRGRRGMVEDGLTVREEPMARHRSLRVPWWKPVMSYSRGNFSPKYTIESCRSPLQFSHFLPVRCPLFSPGLKSLSVFLMVLKSLRYLFSHFPQYSRFLFPCNSDSCFLLTPDLRCNPSVFCDTTCLKMFFSNRVKMAMWVVEGISWSMSV